MSERAQAREGASAPPRVVHYDQDLLVFDKPSGLPTTSPNDGECLVSFARRFDRSAPLMHASSRLDAEVTGVVTFARTERAIAALLQARKVGQYRRFYLGLCAHGLTPASGEWRWSIEQDPRDPRRRIAQPEAHATAMAATSRYTVLESLPHVALVLLRPFTGRTHQLRVHVAKAGAPLLGDRHYGGEARVVLGDGRVVRTRRVMLHCLQVQVPRIAGAREGEADGEAELVLHAPVHADMLTLWQALGGEPSVLDSSQLKARIAQLTD